MNRYFVTVNFIVEASNHTEAEIATIQKMKLQPKDGCIVQVSAVIDDAGQEKQSFKDTPPLFKAGAL